MIGRSLAAERQEWRMRWSRWVNMTMLGLALTLTIVACTGHGKASTPADDSASSATGQGIGDPYYPDDGNRGYDVRGYHVNVVYEPEDQSFDAQTIVRATSSKRLRQFHLDLLGMTVTAVTVDGRPAAFARQEAHELVITPAEPVASDHPFITAVRYHGKPGVDPIDPVQTGWYDSGTLGGGFIAGEPHSCVVWYPCNDHPTDKATFALTA